MYSVVQCKSLCIKASAKCVKFRYCYEQWHNVVIRSQAIGGVEAPILHLSYPHKSQGLLLLAAIFDIALILLLY